MTTDSTTTTAVQTIDLTFATDTQARNLREVKQNFATATAQKASYEAQAQVMKANKDVLPSAMDAVASLIAMENAKIVRASARIASIEEAIRYNMAQAASKANYAEIGMLPEYRANLARKQAEYVNLAAVILAIESKINKAQEIEAATLKAANLPTKK